MLIFVIWLLPTVTGHLTTHIAPAIFNKRKNLLFIECFEKLRIFICAMNNESKNKKMLRRYETRWIYSGYAFKSNDLILWNSKITTPIAATTATMNRKIKKKTKRFEKLNSKSLGESLQIGGLFVDNDILKFNRGQVVST